MSKYKKGVIKPRYTPPLSMPVPKGRRKPITLNDVQMEIAMSMYHPHFEQRIHEIIHKLLTTP